MDQSRIKLTAEEIYKQEFKVDTKGYRIKEVDTFLDEIIKDYQEFSKIINPIMFSNYLIYKPQNTF